MAYDFCTSSAHLTSSAFAIATFVLKCKKAKWDLRERERLHRRSELLAEVEGGLVARAKAELEELDERLRRGEIGTVEAREEREVIEQAGEDKVREIRSIFAIAEPGGLEKRVSLVFGLALWERYGLDGADVWAIGGAVVFGG